MNYNNEIQYPITKSMLQQGFKIKKELCYKEVDKIFTEFVEKHIEYISMKIITNTIDEQFYKKLLRYEMLELCDNNDFMVPPQNMIQQKLNNPNAIIRAKQLLVEKQKYKFDFNKIEHDFNYYGGDRNVIHRLISQRLSNLSTENNLFARFTNGMLPNDIINSFGLDEKTNKAKQEIVEKLKERFPDISIQMDPLGTYILVDWN